MLKLQFLKTLIFLEHFKSYKIEQILAFSFFKIILSQLLRKWHLLLVLNLIK